MITATFSFEAGILLCSKARDFLEEAIFLGKKIKFREGQGWFSREFIVTGERDDVLSVHKVLVEWMENNQND